MDNFFNDIDISIDKPEEEFFTGLVERALTGKQSDFNFIRSWPERNAVKMYQLGIAAIVKIFTNLYKSTYKIYISQVKAGAQDLQTILALKQFKQCLVFYEGEYKIASDMLDEYWEYLWNWHIIDTLVGNYRKEEDLWDHRGRGKNGK